MITQWFTHLATEKEQSEFKKTVESSKSVLDHLRVLLKREKTALEAAEINPKFYETPNWDYKQAYSNGFKAGLAFIDNIINLDQRIIKP